MELPHESRRHDAGLAGCCQRLRQEHGHVFPNRLDREQVTELAESGWLSEDDPHGTQMQELAGKTTRPGPPAHVPASARRPMDAREPATAIDALGHHVERQRAWWVGSLVPQDHARAGLVQPLVERGSDVQPWERARVLVGADHGLVVSW